MWLTSVCQCTNIISGTACHLFLHLIPILSAATDQWLKYLKISHSFLHCFYREVSWICKLYIFSSNSGACIKLTQIAHTVYMPHDAVCNASQWWDFNVHHVTIMVRIQWVSVGLHVCSGGAKSPMGVRLEQRLILCSCNSTRVNEIWINNSQKAGRSIIWHFFDPP